MDVFFPFLVMRKLSWRCSQLGRVPERRMKFGMEWGSKNRRADNVSWWRDLKDMLTAVIEEGLCMQRMWKSRGEEEKVKREKR